MDPGNLPNHVSLTKYSKLLRTTLADEIEIVARALHERFLVNDYQLKNILETAVQQPGNGVSVLIDIIEGSQDHIDKLIQCLSDMGYTGLVRNLKVQHGGRMPDASYVKIQTNFTYLLENITNPEDLCNSLYNKHVLDSYDMEKTKRYGGRIDATDYLLTTLLHSGNVYDTFIKCLKECGYDSVVDRLEMGGGDSTSLVNEVNNAWHTLGELQGNYGNTKKELANLKEETQSMEQKIQLLQESNIEIASNLKHAIGQCEATNTDLAEEKTKHEDTCRELKNTKTDLAEEKAKHEVTRKELISIKNTTESMVKQIQELDFSNKDFAEREAATTYRIQYLESLICKSVNGLGNRGVSDIETAKYGERNHEDTTIEIADLKERVLKLDVQVQNLESSSCSSSKKSPADTNQFSIGKMDHYSLWIEEHIYLVEQFTNDQERVIGVLYTKKVIDDNDKEEIRKERKQNGSADGARKLVAILGNRGKDAMPKIIKALATIKHDVSEHLQRRINEQTKL